MPTVRKRACAACRSRKVKCNGEQVCQQCAHLNLRCSYADSPSGAGPTRAGVQRCSVISQHASVPRSARSARPIALRPASQRSVSAVRDHHDKKFLADIVQLYGTEMHSFHPILAKSEALRLLGDLDLDDNSPASHALLYALAAATLGWTTRSLACCPEVVARVELIINHCLATRPAPCGAPRPDNGPIRTSMFLHLAFVGLQKRPQAWFYLREAVTLTQLLAHDRQWLTWPSTSPDADPDGCRLYWVLFIQERFMGVRLSLPPVLLPLPRLPTPSPGADEASVDATPLLVRLFMLLDAEFFSHFLRKEQCQIEPGSRSAQAIFAWTSDSVAQLDDICSSHEMSRLAGKQVADVLVTKLWLQTLYWQVAMRSCSLTSQHSKLPLQFPVRLGRDLERVIQQTRRDDIQGLGSSIVYKLFELATTIIDVICVTGLEGVEDPESVIRSVRDASFFVMTLDRLEQPQRTVLQAKLQSLVAL